MKSEAQRILLISVRSDIGGGPRQIEEILNYSKPNFEFHIAAPQHGFYSKTFKNKSTSFFDIPFRKFSLIKAISLVNHCKENNIKVIHSHGLGAGIYSKFLSLFGFKTVHTFHGVHPKKTLLSKLKLFTEVTFNQNHNFSISVSRSEYKKLQELNIRSTLIENGVSISQIKSYLPSSKPFPPKKIGVISRLDPHKNVLWFVEQIKYLKKLWPESIFLIAGDGEEREKIEHFISSSQLQDRVSLLGFQAPHHFFEEVDLLVFPSKGEGMPYTVLEAMAANIRLLASDVSGHNDLLPKKHLFELDNLNELIIKIQEIGDYNYTGCLNNFRLEDKIEQINQIYTVLKK